MQNSAYGAQVQQLQATLGVTTQQLFALLEHEIAFYVRPSGAKLPEFTLLLEAPQEAQELSTVDTLMTKIARLSGGAPITAPGGGKTVKLGKYSVTYGGFDSRVILTTAPKGVADAQSTGPKLSSDPAFNEAKAAAHVPDKTGGFLYVNLKDSIPLIEAYEAAQGKQISANTQANLAPLKSVFAFASAKGGVGKFTIFLEIK